MFEEQEKQLKQDGRNNGTEIGNKIYELWFNVAKQHAKLTLKGGAKEMVDTTKEVISFLMRVNESNVYMGQDFEYTQGEFLRHFEKIIYLFRTKPKFKTLLTTVDEVEGYGTDGDGEGLALINWIGKYVLSQLNDLVTKSQVPESLTCSSLKSTSELLKLGHALVAVNPERYATNPFPINAKIIGRLLCDDKTSMLVRDEAQKVGRLSYLNGGELLCRELVRNCVNQYGLQLALEIGALNSEENVSILVRRVQLLDQAHGKSSNREYEMLDTTDTFPTNLMGAIYENAMNIRNTNKVSGYSSKSNDTDEGEKDNKKNAEEKSSFYVAHQEGALVKILRACDTYESHRIAEEDGRERSTELLETVSTLLEISYDSELILELALRPLTLEGLRTVAAWNSNYSERIWLKCLFPLIRSEISKMNVQGVSGDELEQEIIDLLRDCARIKYLNNGGDQVLGFEFANELYFLLLEAIQHGYIETEGFPRICAQMLLVHSEDKVDLEKLHNSSNENSNEYRRLSGFGQKYDANDTKDVIIEGFVDDAFHGSILKKWLKGAFDDAICHKHKTRRAIHEMAMSLIGLNSTSWGLDSESLSKELSDDVLSILTSPPHNAATLEFWNEIARSFPSFLEERKRFIPELLKGIETDVNAMIFSGVIDAYHWAGIVETLTVLASRLSSENAVQLFELFLKVIAMSPPSDIEDDTNARTMYSDECLSHIVSQIEIGAKLSPYAVQEALQIGGTKTKMELAKHIPWAMLRDAHPLVREVAMEYLSKQDKSIIYQCVDDIIFASMPDNCDYCESKETGEEDVAIYDLNIARGATKILAILPCVAPHHVGLCLERLVWSAKITAENHPQSKPSKEVLNSIDGILYSTDASAILKYFLTRDGIRLISKLSKLSPNWATYLKNMQNQGYVQENQKRNSSSGTVSMGRQRKDSMTLEDSGKNLLKLEEQEFVRSANSLVANVDRNQAPVFAPDNNNTVALVGTVVSTEETHQEMNVKKNKKKMSSKKSESSGSGSSKTSDSNLVTTTTHNIGAMNLAYVELGETGEQYARNDPSKSWDALLQARKATFVWNRNKKNHLPPLPVVEVFQINNGNNNDNNNNNTSSSHQLANSMPLAPTHEIEMSDRRSTTTNDTKSKRDYGHKVAL